MSRLTAAFPALLDIQLEVEDCQQLAAIQKQSLSLDNDIHPHGHQHSQLSMHARGGEPSKDGKLQKRGGASVIQGLSAVCCRVLGERLDKRQQCSNWDRRPLLPLQMEYAALDAHILVQLYPELLKLESGAPST
eukprot:CAMPEP_0179413596 /NCGR_PEP_ID=MMETSP0799-20121207/5187_1 /TAXON_ID=46947 /ORGANISM="Geminigera cryophila, Strain CCMP2564" /LENGTH=133 /DNA_ID=CAMNT_0021186087 /DNA_START=426 /DNA_END=827 /DNA_ORIENTATION=+